ncbi:MAG TPA: HAD family hydrolase [Roseiflexaceae bacterium]|nr:HAD family hydrolase [Roseiflexaceae bacterium]
MTTTVVLLDLYRTLIDIRTDERRPETWEPLARFLGYRGPTAPPEQLRDAFFAASKRQRRASRERHPEADLVAVFAGLLRELGQPDPDGRAVEVTQLFRALSMVHLKAFPEVVPTLRRLRGRFRLGLVSNAQRCFLEHELARCGLDTLLDTVVVSSDHGFLKPDPRLFHMALEQLGTTPAQAVYVGDSLEHDICGARAAGIRSVWIDRDAAGLPAKAPCRPDATIEALDELLEVLSSTF